jgi:D-alanyl-D-alanine-carboxypeptidase/D-alanyl-D-alanine-endopeptidase
VGSISKVFCGATLASMAAKGEIAFTDRLQDRIGWQTPIPEKDGKPIRIIDLATHSAGLKREVADSPGPPDDPFRTNTPEAQVAGLAGDPFLFAPGTGVLYSNYGFDLLEAALAHTAGKPYAALLRERVLDPLGMSDTLFTPRPEDRDRLMQGHNFDGSAMPFAPTPETIQCAGGLYTTPDDMLRWLRWHLDRFSPDDREMRLLDHAAYLYRDGLDPVSGVDDGGGDMDAMGLGWVVMLPEGNRPLILHKSGGLQGMFAYVAMAPTRGVAAFAAMNAFNVPGFPMMVETVNRLIADLAPR